MEQLASELNVTWILVAGALVMFMQAGFAFLEIGFSRGKNVGMGVAKIVVNFSIGSIVWWACGFAFAFGGAGWLLGDSGFFFNTGSSLAGGSVGSRGGPSALAGPAVLRLSAGGAGGDQRQQLPSSRRGAR